MTWKIVFGLVFLALIGMSSQQDYSVFVGPYEFVVEGDRDPWAFTDFQPRENDGLEYPEDSENDSTWELIDATVPQHRAAIAAYPWSSPCIITSTGLGLTPLTLEPCASGVDVEADLPPHVYGLFYKKFKTGDQYEQSLKNFQGNPYWEPILGKEDNNGVFTLNGTSSRPGLLRTIIDLPFQDARTQPYYSGFIFRVKIEYYVDIDEKDCSLVIVYKDESIEEETYVCKVKYDGDNLYLETPRIYPLSDIENFATYIQVYNAWKFSNPVFIPVENVLMNPSFSSNNPTSVTGWKAHGSGFVPDLPSAGPSSTLFGSVMMASNPTDRDYGQSAVQAVNFDLDSKYVYALYIGGFVKSLYVTDLQDDNFGINIDANYTNGNVVLGQTIQLPTGTYSDWRYFDGVIQLADIVSALEFAAVFRQHSGMVWFDDLVLRIIRTVPYDVASKKDTPIRNCRGGAFGDVHVALFNGSVIDVHKSPSELNLFKNDNIEVHLATKPFGSGSVTSGVAISTSSVKFSLEYDDSVGSADSFLLPTLYINDVEDSSNLEESAKLFEGSGLLCLHPSLFLSSSGAKKETSKHYNFHFDGGEVMVIAQRIGLQKPLVYYLNVFVTLTKGFFKKSPTGLLGDSCDTLHRTPSLQNTLDRQQLDCTQAQAYGSSFVVKSSKSLFKNSISSSSDPYDCDKYNSLTHFLQAQVSGRKISSGSDFDGDKYEQTIYEGARAWCAEHFLTSFNVSCITDILLTCPHDATDFFSCNTRALAQDYHRFEAVLHAVGTRFNDTITVSPSAFTPEEDDDDDYSWSSGSVLQWGLIAFVVIIVTFLIYKYWRKRKDSAKPPHDHLPGPAPSRPRSRFGSSSASSPGSYELVEVAPSHQPSNTPHATTTTTISMDDIEEYI